MTARPLDIYLGPSAARVLAEEGWSGKRFETLVGASGGPKWLILGHLDRLLFGDFLLNERREPLKAIGSSVGSWRHACLAMDDPVAAIDRFEDIYLNWEYSAKPDVAEVSAASAAMLAHIFGPYGATALINHPLLHTYIVTARGEGLTSAQAALPLAIGMGGAALNNALSRQRLVNNFQRVIFSSKDAPAFGPGDFRTQQVPLSVDSVAKALHASGSIPFVLAGERDIPGAPPGHYWDGGIIDYHFDLHTLNTDSLILYPHFRGDLTTGWFDKFLPWRRQQKPSIDNLVLLCPSDDFVASLPGGKIPDRSDFTRMTPDERQRIWRISVERSRELAEDFAAQLASTDPLAGTKRLEF
ncbi:MAG: hypothetical protein Cons2KO_27010 [Congregibacter sp.]